MSSLFDVLEHISSGPTLLLFGAGPSCELGLPSWKSLALKILREFQELGDAKPVIQLVEEAIRQGNYPYAFETMAKSKGKKWLYDKCKTITSDPGGIGKAYTALAQMFFLGYLTTNYDNIFLRHLKEQKKIVTVHRNSKKEIEQVDFDTLPTFVKLHSDFDGEDTIVLTDEQFKATQFGEEYKYLREFLKSQVLVRRVLIVGYSLKDPDISLILEESARIIRRDVPIYAIVANATKEMIREWDLAYNIKIFPYEDVDGSHSNLVRILDILVEYSGIRQPIRPGLSDSELRDAQHLYMWHKLNFRNEVDSLRGAIDSLMLGLLSGNKEEYISLISLKESISKFISNSTNKEAVLKNSLDNLEKEGLVKIKGENIRILPAGLSVSEKHEDQYRRLCDVFKRQLVLDCKEDMPSIKGEEADKLANVAFNALTDIFRERAIELFDAIFRENPVGVPPSIGMLRLLNRHAQEFSDFKKHTWLIKYCTKVLKHPRKHEGELLSYLARAFYCFQALQLDPEGYSARIRVLIDRMCMIDSNILIPCIADGHPSQSSYKEILKKAKELGMKFCVIKETIVEIERAAKWALDLVKENGERSIEVLFASLGEAGYRPNQFLEAHIEYKEDKNISFAGYLSKIFGGLPNSKSIKNVIGKTLEIKSCVKEDLVRFEGERVDNYRRKVKEEIQRKAEETYASRAVTRVETEATVYTMVALWQEIKKEDVEENRCCFISLGGLLNWLAKSATVGIEQCPIVTIDGLYEILRLSESPKEKMDFFEWIKHNYFTASETLLTSRSAKKYFEKIISSAEEEYLENYEEFNKVLDLKLSKSYLEKIPDLERPGFVKSLKTKMDRIKSEAGFQEKYYKKTIEEIKKGKEKAERGQKYWREQARRLMKGKK